MQFNKWVWLLGVLVVVLISVVIKNRSGKPEGNDVSAERIESARTAQRISSPRSDDSDAMPFSNKDDKEILMVSQAEAMLLEAAVLAKDQVKKELSRNYNISSIYN